MDIWKWFGKVEVEEEPEPDALQVAAAQNKAATGEAVKRSILFKGRTRDLLGVSQGALDVLSRVERKHNNG